MILTFLCVYFVNRDAQCIMVKREEFFYTFYLIYDLYIGFMWVVKHNS